MLRHAVLCTLILGSQATAIHAWQEQANTRIYVALYNIKYSDIPQWVASYNAVDVPILDALVADGTINAYNMLMHHTGGEYTIRQGLIGDDDTNFDAAWEDYLSRVTAASPAANEQRGRMILAHADEIWDLNVTNLPPEGATTQYAYEIFFQVSFADMERWNGLWADDLLPVLDQSMRDGLLQGYVVQGHNTGGPFNWKVLLLYDEWDDFDELEAGFFGAAPLDHPLWTIPMAHRDELWQALPVM